MEKAPGDPRPKVFIVEDDHFLRTLYLHGFEVFVEVIFACTIKEGFEQYKAHSNVSAIVVDGRYMNHIGHYRPFEETLEFVSFLRRIYNGPIVTSASDEDDQTSMMEAGCTDRCPNKWSVHTMILGLLGFKESTDDPNAGGRTT
jgi:hypothetical protein